MNKPTFITTFSGCGGSSLGCEWAGFHELLAIDWEANAVETFRRNFPTVPVWQRDISQVSAEEILEFCKIKPGDLDLFQGSPPCQGFSTAGKRQVNDPRNDLFQEFTRLIDGLQPKVFIMENVSGMFKGKMAGRFKEIHKTLKALNYEVKCKLMNSKYYGVPQSRQRLIWIGVRKDLNIEPSFPTPSNKIITAEEALKNLVITEKPELPSRKIVTKVLLKCKEGETGANYNDGSFFNWQRIARHKPCPTITKTACLLHWSQNRYLTIQELKRFSTFPDSFQFVGSHKQAFNRVGNAVMPRFMEKIAEHIRINILKQ